MSRTKEEFFNFISAKEGVVVKNLDKANRGDILILEVDLDIWSIGDCLKIFNSFESLFPNNACLIIPKGMELKKLNIEK